MKSTVMRSESTFLFVAALGLQLLVGGLAWVAGWTLYASFLVWLVLAVEMGGVAVAIWIQRLVGLPLWRILAGLEVLGAVSAWRAWADRARAEAIPPPPNLGRMGPDEAHYRNEVTRWASWSLLDWGLLTAATGVAWWAFSSLERFRW